MQRAEMVVRGDNALIETTLRWAGTGNAKTFALSMCRRFSALGLI